MTKLKGVPPLSILASLTGSSESMVRQVPLGEVRCQIVDCPTQLTCTKEHSRENCQTSEGAVTSGSCLCASPPEACTLCGGREPEKKMTNGENCAKVGLIQSYYFNPVWSDLLRSCLLVWYCMFWSGLVLGSNVLKMSLLFRII